MSFGFWVSAQPKFTTAEPDTVSPWPGVSMVPNGLVAWALSQVMVRDPSAVIVPSASRAYMKNW